MDRSFVSAWHLGKMKARAPPESCSTVAFPGPSPLPSRVRVASPRGLGCASIAFHLPQLIQENITPDRASEYLDELAVCARARRCFWLVPIIRAWFFRRHEVPTPEEFRDDLRLLRADLNSPGPSSPSPCIHGDQLCFICFDIEYAVCIRVFLCVLVANRS